MTEQATTTGPLPIVPFVKLPEGAEPYLEGHKCQSCGAVFVGERNTCSKCFTTGKMEVIKLADTGRLYTYTVVYRSFPGTKVPFVSAIVDLDGGGTLKGNLINIDPDPEKIKTDIPVKVVFADAGRQDAQGNSYTSYFFEPLESA